MDCANLSDQRECLRDQGTGPSPSRARGGGQILNLVGDDPMVNPVISKLLKNESLVQLRYMCYRSHLRIVAPSLSATLYHRAIESKQAATDSDVSTERSVVVVGA